MSDPTYPLFSVFSFLGFVLSFVPLSWHLQAWNAGTCMYMFWAGFASLIQFVDSLVWNGSVENKIPVWCDITTKFIIGAGVGIPAASLCINRRLYNIAAVRQTSMGPPEKRRAMYFDLAIGFGIPVIVMCLHAVVQGHRFNIAEDIGCLPTIYVTPLAFPLVFMWPALLGLVSFVYASMTLRAFWIRRVQFREVLSLSQSMSMSRYFRLMLLSCLEMALTVPLAIYTIYINVHGVPVAPWISWADTHYDFGRVLQIPAVFWRADHQAVIAYEMGRWIYPCAAFIFFGLFGFADEACRHYKAAFWWLVKPFGCKPQPCKSLPGSGLSLPSSPTPRTPTSADRFLSPYAGAGRHIIMQSSFNLAHKLEALDIEKTTDSSAAVAYALYLENKIAQAESPELDCIIVPQDYTIDGLSDAELDFPATPTTACSLSSEAEADIGAAQ